ncbi:hypothetical protein SHIRM173S_02823 [Streptomyces hirsutus]
MQVGTAADGVVEHGLIGARRRALGAQRVHGPDRAARRPRRVRGRGGTAGPANPRDLRVLRGWLAGVGLLSFTWPGQMDHPPARTDWLEQQTETAWAPADDLDGPDWSTLSLPVDGLGALAGRARRRVRQGHERVRAWFAVVKDITAYAS